jgi:glycosyltransferase involved in cell wall biosynthesis
MRRRRPELRATSAPADGVARGGGEIRRLFVNGRFLTQQLEGVQRTAAEVVEALDGLLDVGVIDQGRWRVTLLAPPGPLRPLRLRHVELRQAGRFRGHLWEQLELPWLARTGTLLSLCNAAPLLKRRHLVTLHDAAVFAAPAGYSAAFSRWYRFLFACLGRTAHGVLTVSEFSRGELARHAGIPGHKLRVIPQGALHLDRLDPDTSVLERFGLRGEPFVLLVGSRNPNKNVAAVLRAMECFSAPRPVLVVAGGANVRVFRPEDGVGREERERVVHLGYVSDGELKALYREAAVFVFPSLYEGFGFPPVEAMSCGCPVLVSDIPVLREVCGDAAGYFDPHDPHAIASAISRVLEDPEYRDRLRQRGRERVSRLTWEACAREIWAAVEAAAGEGRGSA